MRFVSFAPRATLLAATLVAPALVTSFSISGSTVPFWYDLTTQSPPRSVPQLWLSSNSDREAATSTQDIDESTQKLILGKIHQIEKDHHVKVLYACESGSRAWGFPSADSDYDVRFIYVHPTEWYLSVNIEKKKRRRDVIELPIDENNLDINGWDLQKALGLLGKSNPPLLEWLGSPIVYMEQFGTAQKMRSLLVASRAYSYYSPTSCMYHYFSMAKSNYRDYLRGEQVRTKKYFYVLRPLLAVIWLEMELGLVPTRFQDLIEGTLPDGELKTAIYNLMEQKMVGEEMDTGPAIPVISEFITDQISRLEDAKFQKKKTRAPVEQLDQVFQETLQEVWK